MKKKLDFRINVILNLFQNLKSLLWTEKAENQYEFTNIRFSDEVNIEQKITSPECLRNKFQDILPSPSREGKKAAFTLAEVLITLTILGVVAAIMVPSLVKMNTKRTQVTKLAKAYATLENMAQNLAANTNCIGRDITCTGLFNISDEEQFGKKFIELSGLRGLKFYSGRWPQIKPLNYKRLGSSAYRQEQATPFVGTHADMIYAPKRHSVNIYDSSVEYGRGKKDGILITIFTDGKNLLNEKGNIINYAEGTNKTVMGRDVFMFVIWDNFKVEPAFSGYHQTGFWPLSQLGKDSIYVNKSDTINRLCDPESDLDKEGTYNTGTLVIQGNNCAARIIRDGWKMKY